jgi:hypothetical protein
MGNQKWRGVPIETLKKYLAGQPTHVHTMLVDEQGEVVEVTHNEPPEVVPQPSEE